MKEEYDFKKLNSRKNPYCFTHQAEEDKQMDNIIIFVDEETISPEELEEGDIYEPKA